MKAVKRIIAAVAALTSALIICSCSALTGGGGYMRITIYKIGKADAILVNTEKSAVLIDAGEDDDGEELLSKIAALNIEKLDKLIITHYDKDHIGGAAEVIRGIEIGEIVEPGYKKDSEEYAAFVSAAEEKGIKRTVPEESETFSLDGANWSLLMPKSDDYSDENDYSIALRAEYLGYSAFFAGDAMDRRMEELTLLGSAALRSDILKAPHHGSYESRSKEFFSTVAPTCAVITCSDKNPPDDETIDCLKELGITPCLTSDGDVEIIFSKNGIDILQ